jgi:hypothetical protein
MFKRLGKSPDKSDYTRGKYTYPLKRFKHAWSYSKFDHFFQEKNTRQHVEGFAEITEAYKQLILFFLQSAINKPMRKIWCKVPFPFWNAVYSKWIFTQPMRRSAIIRSNKQANNDIICIPREFCGNLRLPFFGIARSTGVANVAWNRTKNNIFMSTTKIGKIRQNTWNERFEHTSKTDASRKHLRYIPRQSALSVWFSCYCLLNSFNESNRVLWNVLWSYFL